MNFGQAFAALLDGKNITRAGWNRKGSVLGIQPPTGLFTTPTLYVQFGNGDCVPYTPYQDDLMASDWILAPEAGKMASSLGQTQESAQRQPVPEHTHA